MRAKGRTYKEIHDFITEKGYAGTVASLRMFMQKERAHQKEASKAASTDNSEVEYIQRKSLCKLIYSKLEDVTMLTGEQYNAAIQKYPILGKMYSLVKEAKEIIKRVSRDFDGNLTDAEVIELVGLARNTYYKYKRELRLLARDDRIR